MTSTDRRLDAVLAALRERQQDGVAPLPGHVSRGYLSRLSVEIGQPLSKSAIRRAEAMAIAKIRANPEAMAALAEIRTLIQNHS